MYLVHVYATVVLLLQIYIYKMTLLQHIIIDKFEQLSHQSPNFNPANFPKKDEKKMNIPFVRII